MTKYYNFQKGINQEELELCAKKIKQGELIIFPTETVYGIGANAFSKGAVKNIFIAKGRARWQPSYCTYCTN